MGSLETEPKSEHCKVRIPACADKKIYWPGNRGWYAEAVETRQDQFMTFIGMVSSGM